MSMSCISRHTAIWHTPRVYQHTKHEYVHAQETQTETETKTETVHEYVDAEALGYVDAESMYMHRHLVDAEAVAHEYAHPQAVGCQHIHSLVYQACLCPCT